MNHPSSLSMKPDSELDRLFALARQARPDTARAELAFETRLLARLRAEAEEREGLGAWAWRLAPWLGGVAAVAALAWSLAGGPADPFPGSLADWLIGGMFAA